MGNVQDQEIRNMDLNVRMFDDIPSPFKEDEPFQEWDSLVLAPTRPAQWDMLLNEMYNLRPFFQNLSVLAVSLPSTAFRNLNVRSDDIFAEKHPNNLMFLNAQCYGSFRVVEFRNFIVDALNYRRVHQQLLLVAEKAEEIHLRSIVDVPFDFTKFPNLKSLSVGLDRAAVRVLGTMREDVSSFSTNPLYSDASCIEKINFNHLVNLAITTANLASLPDDMFAHNNVLESLDLSRNALSSLPSSLVHCQSLRRLILRNNRFTEFPSSILSCIPSLRHLSFSNDVIFSGTVHFLNYNKFDVIFINYPSFNNMEVLKMKLTRVKEFRLAEGISFDHFKEVDIPVPGIMYRRDNDRYRFSIYLYNRNLYGIPEEERLFYYRYASTCCIRLDDFTSDRDFNALASGFRALMPRVNRIVLKNTCPVYKVLNNSSSLETFRIDFSRFRGIKYFYAQDTLRMIVDDSILTLSDTLVILKIDCQIDVLTPRLHEMKSLRVLSLGMSGYVAEVFPDVTSLNKTHLMNIATLLISPDVLPNIDPSLFQQLRALSLTMCGIESMPTLKSTTLQYLDLSLNKIQDIGSVLHDLPALSHLSLQCNLLTPHHISATLEQYSRLVILDMSSMKNAEISPFSHKNNLGDLCISGNKLPVLTTLVVSHSQVSSVQLDGEFHRLQHLMWKGEASNAFTFTDNASFPALEYLYTNNYSYFPDVHRFPSLKAYKGGMLLTNRENATFFISHDSFPLMQPLNFDAIVYSLIIENPDVVVTFDNGLGMLRLMRFAPDDESHEHERYPLRLRYMYYSDGTRELETKEQRLDGYLQSQSFKKTHGLTLRKEPYMKRWIPSPSLAPHQQCAICLSMSPDDQETREVSLDNRFLQPLKRLKVNEEDDRIMCTCNILQTDVTTTFNINHNICGIAQSSGQSDADVTKIMKGHNEHFFCRGCFREHLRNLADADKPLCCPFVRTYFCNPEEQ